MDDKTDTRKDKEPEYQKMLADLSTSVDWADYVKYVQTMAERRKKAGLLKDDLDFALGASTAFFYFSRGDKLPSSWIFNPLGNVSPFYDGHNKDSEFYKEQKYKEKKKR